MGFRTQVTNAMKSAGMDDKSANAVFDSIPLGVHWLSYCNTALDVYLHQREVFSQHYPSTLKVSVGMEITHNKDTDVIYNVIHALRVKTDNGWEDGFLYRNRAGTVYCRLARLFDGDWKEVYKKKVEFKI